MSAAAALRCNCFRRIPASGAIVGARLKNKFVRGAEFMLAQRVVLRAVAEILSGIMFSFR